jgi:peptidoglycan/LPS O-acetylase OafA/YrhL
MYDPIQNDNARFTVLDGWRGIAAACVALFHFQGPSHLVAVPLIKNGFLFVDFFFVLSGFVISHAYATRLSTQGEFWTFASRRLARVWPLHMAVLAGFIAVETLKYVVASGAGIHTATPAFDPAGATALAAIPSHVFLLHGLGINSELTWNYPSWSISSEFWTYLVFAAAVLMSGRYKVFAFACLATIGAGVVIANSHGGIDVTFDLGWFRCVYGFFVGCLVYAARKHVVPVSDRWASFVELATLVAVTSFIALAGRSSLSFAAPLVFAVAVHVFGQQNGPVSRILEGTAFQKLGEWSYSIYMVHGLVAFVLGLAISVLQRKFGFELWHTGSAGGSASLNLVSDHMLWLDALHVAYIATVILVAQWTYRTIETPGRMMFARAARHRMA